MNGFRVADKDRHAHAGDGQLDRRVDHLLGLVPHLGFFVRVAIRQERPDLRDHVEGDFLLENDRGGLVIDEDAFRLVPQLVHRFLAGAGDRLVGRDDNALDADGVMQRLQRDNQLGRRAVGVRDDALLGVAHDRIGVHFRHHEGHVLVHPPGGGVVDDDRAGGGDLRAPFPRHLAARRHQHDVDLREVELLEVMAFQGAVAIRDFLADRAARGDGVDFVCGEQALVENVEELPPDIARGADDCDARAHDFQVLFRSVWRLMAQTGSGLKRLVQYAPGWQVAGTPKRDP